MVKITSSNNPIFLLSEEKIIRKANPHWLFLAIPMIEAFAFFLLYAFIACPFLGIVLHGLDWFCYFLSVFVLLFLFVVLYLDWKFNRLYLTNFRLIKERGIIGKRFLAIQLKKIQDITCEFGILGRLFGFGKLIIESAGTEGKMVFEGLLHPQQIKGMIENEIPRSV
jgi:uncharacterized membrane protein YdbT with pleckstrin-like domain